MAPRKPKVPKNKAAKEARVTLGDTAGMKHALDAAVIECFVDSGYEENHTYSNIKLLLSFLSIGLALIAQFYPGTLKENWFLVFGCVVGYVILSVVLTIFSYAVQKDAILITKSGKKNMVPLRVSTTLPRFSEHYTVSIEAADPRQHPDIRSVELTNGVGKYFYSDGALADNALSHDISKLIHSLEKKD